MSVDEETSNFLGRWIAPLGKGVGCQDEMDESSNDIFEDVNLSKDLAHDIFEW